MSADFLEALQALQKKEVVPTNMTTAELRQLSAGLRRSSFYSAQNIYVDVLDEIKKGVESILHPVEVKREDRVTPENPEGRVNEGKNPAQVRADIKNLFEKIGYTPDEPGAMTDLSSDRRINLVVKTQTQIAQSIGQHIQGNDPDALEAYPALELIRFEDREVPRGFKKTKEGVEADPENGWEERWKTAADSSGDDDAARMLEEHGRMVARKDSPIWAELGSSENFDDALDNPFPPFAFNSGMGTIEVSADDCAELGLPVENVQPTKLDFTEIFDPKKFMAAA